MMGITGRRSARIAVIIVAALAFALGVSNTSNTSNSTRAVHYHNAPVHLTAEQVPAINNDCALNGTWCVLWNQYQRRFTGHVHNTYLTTTSQDSDIYHWFPRPTGTWGEIKNLSNNECWNYNPTNENIAVDGCDSTFTNPNELWYFKYINSGNQIVISNYRLGIAWFVWGSFYDDVRLSFDSHLYQSTELASVYP